MLKDLLRTEEREQIQRDFDEQNKTSTYETMDRIYIRESRKRNRSWKVLALAFIPSFFVSMFIDKWFGVRMSKTLFGISGLSLTVAYTIYVRKLVAEKMAAVPDPYKRKATYKDYFAVLFELLKQW